MKLRIDHFRFLAPHYETFVHPQESEKITTWAQRNPNGIVLDAGGGTGRVSQFLLGKAAQVVVADETFEMLRVARKKEGIQAACSHTEGLPFKNDTFGTILMVDALHHVADQPETAAELWRVLAPGGRIIIEEPDIHAFGVKLMALAEKLALMRSHFLSAQQILALFQDSAAKKHAELEDSSAWVIVEK